MQPLCTSAGQDQTEETAIASLEPSDVMVCSNPTFFFTGHLRRILLILIWPFAPRGVGYTATIRLRRGYIPQLALMNEAKHPAGHSSRAPGAMDIQSPLKFSVPWVPAISFGIPPVEAHLGLLRISDISGIAPHFEAHLGILGTGRNFVGTSPALSKATAQPPIFFSPARSIDSPEKRIESA